MNALVSLDSILEPQQALTATSLFGSGQVETILAAIEKDVRAELFDIETLEGRDRIKSVAYKIARSKTTLDEIGKEHVAAIKAQSAGIDKERKTLRDRLDALKDEVREPLTAWETREAKRVADHEGILADIISGANLAQTACPESIRILIAGTEGCRARDWEEFRERADVAIAEALAKLEPMLAAAEQRERDAAELEALRREKAERDRKDAEEAARKLAEQAEIDRQTVERARAERSEEEKAAAVAAAIAAAEAKAERDQAAAIEAERRRQEQAARDAAAKKAAEEAAEKKRQENKRHREKVHARIAAGLIACGCVDTEGSAQAIVSHIVAGNLPNLKIEY